MTWFKSDDSFWRHPKVRKLGKDRLPAVGLWQLAGTWCADNIATNVTDGFVPGEQVEAWDPRHRYAKRLVAVGLWEEVEIEGEHGYLFHDWSDYNPTKAEVEAEREKWRAKKAGQRKTKPRQGESPRDTPEDTPETEQGKQQETVPESPTEFPDPIPVPVPVPSSGSFGGEGHLGDAGASAQRPSERCLEHADDPTPPPCRGCLAARLNAEAWDRDQIRDAADRRRLDAQRRDDDRRRAIANCQLCDANGYAGRQVCTHDPDAAERAARGRAAVRAALNANRSDPPPPDQRAAG